MSPVIISLLFGVATLFYVSYHTSKREGFLEEQIVDLVILIGLAFYLFGKLGYMLLNPTIYGYYSIRTVYVAGTDIAFGIYGSALVFYLYVKVFRRWSVAKVGDVLSKALAGLSAIVALGFFIQVRSPLHLILFWVFGILFLILNYLEHKELFGVSSSSFRIKRVKPIVFSGGLFYIFLISIFSASFLYSLFSKTPFSKIKALLFFFSLAITMIHMVKKASKKGISKSLTRSWVENLKRRLLKEKEKIKQEELELVQEDPFMVEGRDDDNSEEGDEVMEMLGRREVDMNRGLYKKAMMRINRVLAKINLGTYGKCDICKKPIGKERLKANPYASLCLHCAQKKDEQIH